MNKTFLAAAFAASAIGSAVAQPNVNVSIGISQPGVYGRINIGDYPRPALVLPEPVIIAPPQYAMERQPIYLYVPPAHQQDWRRYCGHYAACGQPVYFVQDQWVRDRYQEAHPGWDRGHPHGSAQHDKHGNDGRQDAEHRNGHGNGNGHEQGRD